MRGHEMKKRLYRAGSSRSFTRSLSIVAVAVVAFAALELLAVQQALAGVWCCNSTNCTCDASLACPTNFSTNTGKLCYTTGAVILRSALKSTINCTNIVPGSSTFDPTSFERNEILFCKVTESEHNGEGFCKFNVLYTRQDGLTLPCVVNPDGTSTQEHAGFCSQVSDKGTKQLKVAGTLTCGTDLNPEPPEGAGLPGFCLNDQCILRVGIQGEQGHCSDLVPGDPTGRVLTFSQTFAESKSCTGQVSKVDGPSDFQCNGGTFDGAEVDCFDGNNKQGGTEFGPSIVQFDPLFSPMTLNVSCNNQDFWRFRMSSNQSFEPGLVVATSLTVEGFSGVTCDDTVSTKKGVTYRDCKISACSTTCTIPELCGDALNLGRFVAEQRNQVDLTIDLTVAGKLNSGTLVGGTQHVTTSGQ
jgi:hypothetical protein